MIFYKIGFLLALFIFVILFFSIGYKQAFGALSCSVVPSASCTGLSVKVLRMSSTTNAHAEYATGTTPAYDNVVCCNAISTLNNTCFNASSTVAYLSSSTNAHASMYSTGTTDKRVCLSSQSSRVLLGFQDTNCSGYDTTLLSLSSADNAHVGSGSAYTKKLCGSENPLTISVSLSTTSVSFGNLSSSQVRFASGTSGSSVDTHAFTLDVATNVTSSWSVGYIGDTLKNIATTTKIINPIMNTNPLVAGVSSFGLSFLTSDLSNATSSLIAPYNDFDYSFITSTTSPYIFANGYSLDGLTATTTIYVKAGVSIPTIQEEGSYRTNLSFVIVPSF